MFNSLSSHRVCRAITAPVLLVAVVLLAVSFNAQAANREQISSIQAPAVFNLDASPFVAQLLDKQVATLPTPSFGNVGRDRLVALQIIGTPLSFSELPAGDRVALAERFGDDAAQLYETALAEQIAQVLSHADGRTMTVLGLPVEPAGNDTTAAQRVNDNYGRVIERLDVLVSTKSFILLDSGVSEAAIVSRGMTEAVRLRESRPLVFRTNGRWRLWGELLVEPADAETAAPENDQDEQYTVESAANEELATDGVHIELELDEQLLSDDTFAPAGGDFFTDVAANDSPQRSGGGGRLAPNSSLMGDGGGGGATPIGGGGSGGGSGGGGGNAGGGGGGDNAGQGNGNNSQGNGSNQPAGDDDSGSGSQGGGDQEISGPIAVFSNLPNEYVIGSGLDLHLTLQPHAPSSVDHVVFQVWSSVSASIEAAVPDWQAPFSYPSNMLDTVTPGGAYVQALVRDSDSQMIAVISVPLEFVLPAPTPPAAPSGANAIDAGAGNVQLTWQDNADNETGFEIQRDPAFPGGNVSVNADVTTYSDDTGNGTFRYRVRSFNDVGASSFTPWTEVTVQSEPQQGQLGQFVNAPAEYVLGSSQNIDFILLPGAPDTADHVIFQVWSAASGAVEAAVPDWSEPFSYPGVVLDTVTPGAGQLQALVRTANNTVLGTVKHDLVFVEEQDSPPAAPSAVTASDAGLGVALVTWSDNADNETGYHIQRNPAFADGIMTLGANTTSFQDQTGNGTFSYRLRAFNDSGNSSWSSWANVNITSEPAPAPIGEFIDLGDEYQLGSGQSVTFVLSDDAPAEADRVVFHVWSFETNWIDVSYLDTSAPYVLPGYELNKVTPGLAEVRASVRDANDNQLGMVTQQVTFLEPVFTIPDAPTGLTAVDAGMGRVALSWIDNSDNEEGFELQRDPAFQIAVAVDANETSFEEHTGNGDFQYRVRAFNDAGFSPWTGWVSVTVTSGPDDGEWGYFVGLGEEYVLGSTVDHQLQLLPAAPGNIDHVVFQVWSSASQSIEAPVADNEAPFVYPGSYLDQVTPGNGHVQALLRDSNNVVLGTISQTTTFVEGAPTIPNAPSGAAAVDAGNGAIQLTWSDNSNNESGFHIQRNPAFSGGEYVTVGANATSYSQTTGNGTFQYRVRAFNSAGNSAWTSWATVTVTSAPAPPAAPSNASAIDDGGGQMLLTWTDNATNELGFHIERSGDSTYPGGGYISVGANITSFNEMPGNGTFQYRVRAFNASGTSSWTNWASVTIVSAPQIPTPPSNLTATDSEDGRALLNWVDNSDNEDGFEIQRNPSFTGGNVTVNTGVTSYTDNSGNGTFSYRVRSFNVAGDSAWTNWRTVQVTGGDGGGQYPDTHEFTGLPLTEDGWTDLLGMYQNPNLYTDTRIIYVSQSQGSDSNGVWYTPGAPVVGPDPFNPVGPIQAFRSIEAGFSQLRNNRADILLLKRGDTWNEEAPRVTKSGKSKLERMIIGAYGSGPRPKINTGTGDGFTNTGGNEAGYLVFTSLQLYPGSYDGSGNPRGFRLRAPGSDILIEDCHVSRYGTNIVIDSAYTGQLKNVSLRRTISVDAYSTNSHSQGLFANHLDGLYIDECIIDRNGWDPNISGAYPTIYNHNMYINFDATNVTVRNTISMSASSHGLQIRPGGLVENNVFARNSIAMLIRDPEGVGVVARGNVILDGKDISDSLPRGFAINIAGVSSSALVTKNISANTSLASMPRMLAVQTESGGGVHNAVVRDNIWYNWGGRMFIEQANAQNSSVALIDNVVTNLVDDDALVRHQDSASVAAISSSNNKFFSIASPGQWFRIGNDNVNLSAWASAVNDNGSYAGNPDYPNPERTLATYAGHIGLNATHEAFAEAVRQQARGNWNPDLTATAIQQYFLEGFGLTPDWLEE